MIEPALSALRALPQGKPALRRLNEETSRKTIEPLHPLELSLRIRTMLDEGMVEAAKARLIEGLRAHPKDPELIALREEVDALDAG